jgi:hypothetical protein
MTQGMVTREDIWESVTEMCKVLGFRNAERFFTDPATSEPPDPGPTIEEQKLESERDIKLRELEVRELDIRLTHEREMLKLGVLAVAPQPDPVSGGMSSEAPPQMPPVDMGQMMPPEAYRA